MMKFNPVPSKSGLLNKAIALALASGAFSAVAEEVKTLEKTKLDEKEQQTYKIDKVSNHKISTDLLDTARVINVVNSEVLSDQGVSSLNDALKNVSGVSTFGAGEGGGGNITTNDKITIRGFNANGNIYIDGVRDLAGYSRDLFNTEQIEVNKGAASSLSGKGTSGGSVNLVTKKALGDKFVELKGSYDDVGTLRVTGDYNTELSENSALRINALYTDGGDVFDNGVENYQTQAIAPAFSAQLSEKFKLQADALFMTQDNTPMLGLPFVTEAVAEQLGLKEGPVDTKYWGDYYGVESRDFEELDVTLATLVLEYSFNSKLVLRNQTRVGENSKKSVLSRPLFRNERDPDTGDRTYFNDISISWTQNLDEEHSLFVNQTDLLVNFDTGDIKQDLVLGLEIYSEEKTSQRLDNNIELESDSVPLGSPRPGMPYTGGIDIGGNPSETEGEGTALYALNTISIGDSWLVTAGLRYEDYEAAGARYVWERIDGSWVSSYVSGLKSDASFTSWNLSVGYKPSESSFVYVSAANSQDPAAGDLAFTWSETAIEQIGNLDPQEAENIEIGGKVDLVDERLQLAGAYFVTTKTVTDRNDDGNYFLAGEQEVKGFEFSLTGNINDSLGIAATYTSLDSEVTKDFSADTRGNGLTAAPDESASLWLDYKLNAWQFGAGLNYSSGNVYWRRNRAYYDTDSVTLVQLMAGYQFDEELSVQFNIDNVMDEEYVTDYSARGHFRPGDPRIMKVSFTYRF